MSRDASPEAMSGAELGEALDDLGWSVRHLALRELEVAVTTCQRWRSGETDVPPGIARWLRGRVSSRRVDPPPSEWWT